ncbi:MAG: hypothetical protein HC848_02630 [Limnobacter sp.]|nr:hypothetical protein [Limnobacter sp.]
MKQPLKPARRMLNLRFLYRALRYAALFGALSLSAGCQKNPPPQSLLKLQNGKYTISRILDSTPISGMSEEAALALPGSVLTVSPELIRFQDMDCTYPELKKPDEAVRSFFAWYQLNTPEEWKHIRSETLDISCQNGRSFGPILLAGNTLLFVWYGVLLEAKK